jgi:hypothetical protein
MAGGDYRGQVKAAADTIGDDASIRLMARLRLPACYYPALVNVVKQGKWRSAKTNPIGYVIRAAKYQAIKLGLAERQTPELTIADLKLPRRENWDHPGSWSGVAAHDAVIDYLCWYYDDGSEYWEEKELYSEALGSYIPRHLYRIPPRFLVRQPDGEFTIDAEALGCAAGLDEDERTVLACKFAGVSREKLISSQLTEEEKKAAQAAWRRFDCKHGLEMVRTILQDAGKVHDREAEAEEGIGSNCEHRTTDHVLYAYITQRLSQRGLSNDDRQLLHNLKRRLVPDDPGAVRDWAQTVTDEQAQSALGVSLTEFNQLKSPEIVPGPIHT